MPIFGFSVFRAIFSPFRAVSVTEAPRSHAKRTPSSIAHIIVFRASGFMAASPTGTRNPRLFAVPIPSPVLRISSPPCAASALELKPLRDIGVIVTRWFFGNCRPVDSLYSYWYTYPYRRENIDFLNGFFDQSTAAFATAGQLWFPWIIPDVATSLMRLLRRNRFPQASLIQRMVCSTCESIHLV